MKLCQLNLTTKCNFSCPECPNGKWRNFSEKPQYRVNNANLFRFLRHLPPEEWEVELSGGEPSLYDGIDELVNWLELNGYCGEIKTNGSRRIPRRGSMRMVSAWHRWEQKPIDYDVILIVRNLFEQEEDKVRYCEDNGIPYRMTYRIGDSHPKYSHSIDGYIGVNPAGTIVRCPKMTANDSMPRISDDEYSLPKGYICPWCKSGHDYEIFRG